MRPPPGCTLTPKNTYLLLLKTLYGIQCSPCHWYEKAKKILEELGLTQCPNSPCLFHSILIEEEPLIYAGVYVDDIAYYSLSDTVEKKFKEGMGEKVSAIEPI
eukprot:14430123-Ditylum_brightwellii.AAC.1